MDLSEMPSRMYAFVRGRQLDGTFPGSPLTGVWPLTDLRIRKGWGMPPERAWPYSDKEWPPAEPPGVDQLAKTNRLFAYTRIRTLDDVRRILTFGRPIVAAFEIDASWGSAPNGQIANPDQNPPDGSHAIAICGYDDSKQELRFANSWGESWGDAGYGTLPYAYWEARLVESWHLDLDRPASPETPGDGLLVARLGVFDVFGRQLHIVETIDRANDDVVGWAFVVETPDTLEIEEIFVRPTYRRQGYGRELVSDIEKLRPAQQKPLLAWIPHADLLGAAAKSTLDRLGLEVGPSPVRWAAGRATERSSSAESGMPPPPGAAAGHTVRPPSFPLDLWFAARDPH